MTQHAGLTEERWATFRIDQQVLMIANEMNRTARLLEEADAAARRRGYERTLRLTDLTVSACRKASLRRELLRWRDLVAAAYAAPDADPSGHRDAMRALLLLDPVAARQIPHVVGERRATGASG